MNFSPDVFCCAETWCTKERLLKYNWVDTLKTNYEIICIDAIKEKTQGRHKAGFLVGVRKGKLNIMKSSQSSNKIHIKINDTSSNAQLRIGFAYFSPDKSDDISFQNYITSLQRDDTDIVMGDFNARIGGTKTHGFKDTKYNNRGRFLASNLLCHQICNGKFKGDEEGEFTFINKNGSSTVDLSFISKKYQSQVKSFKVNHSEYSHHAQILMSISSHNSTCKDINTTTKIKWEDKKRTNFLQQLHKLQDKENCTYEKIKSLIFKSAKIAGLKTTQTLKNINTQVRWNDDELIKLKSHYRYCVRQFRKCSNCDIPKLRYCRSAMLSAKENYLKKSEEKKVRYYENLKSKLLSAKNGKMFWSALDVFRKGRTSSGSSEIEMETWKAHFSSVFKSTNITEKVLLPECHDEILDAEFTMFELVIAIKKLSNGKAPGNDGIPNEVWKSLTTQTRLDLLNLFNSIYNNPEQTPKVWSEIIIVPIFKKGDPSLPSNYRPISLLNTVTKLFTTILTARLDEWCKKNNKISEFQAGFKTGTGCIEQAFVLNTIIQNQVRNKKSQLFTLFVDLSQAFDSVDHNLLWKKLVNKGVSSKFISVMRQIYSQAHARVRVNGQFTSDFSIERSVLQGESLSPKLFTLFLDDIVDHLKLSNGASVFIGKHSVDMLLFADDIALIALSARDLQIKINSIKQYFELNNLKVNLSKTKVVVFRRRKKLDNYKFLWDTDCIEIVDMYTYLGICFHYKGGFEQAFTVFLNKAKQAKGSLVKLFQNAGINNFTIQESLFNSLCDSVLMYGVVLWGFKFIDKLATFQNKFIRQLYYLQNEVPRYQLLLETNAKPVEVKVLGLVLKFLHRIYMKPDNSLVKNCFHRLICIQKSGNKNLNWFMQLNSFLDNCGIKGLDKNLSFVSNLKKVNVLCIKYEQFYKNYLVQTMISSSKSYKILKSHVRTEPYLNSSLKFAVKRFTFQLRCGKNNIYVHNASDILGNRKNNYKNCDMCGLGMEDTHHVFCICPHYKSERLILENQLKFKIQNISSTDYQQFIAKQTKNINSIGYMFTFWMKCIRIREFIRTY